MSMESLGFFRNHSWPCTASPARLTNRSELGNTAGVSVAVRSQLDNRPVSICSGALGTRTPNAQLTARLFTADKLEILATSGYYEGEIGNTGYNLEFITDRSAEGTQFVKGFGGIGGTLRWKVDLAELNSYEEAANLDAGGDGDSDSDDDDDSESDRDPP